MLFEVLEGLPDGTNKYTKNPKMKYHKLENQQLFLKQVASKGIKLVNIGAEDLHDGNGKLILGLTWTLILRYEIHKFGADEAMLLRWVTARTQGYEGVAITNWR